MNIVLLQSKIPERDLLQLSEEFPQILFIQTSDILYKSLSAEEWAKVEILYGYKLSASEFEMASQLKWIHSPLSYLNLLCTKELKEHGNVMITVAEEENVYQVAEYVISGILAFTKNLFHWHDTNKNPDLVWDSKWRDNMTTLKGKRLIQVGLGEVGTEIARRAKLLDLDVWGISYRKTFHPWCSKVFTFKEMKDILPYGDVVSVSMPRHDQRVGLFGEEEFDAMKEDSILTLVGMKTVFDEKGLTKVASNGKFRGIFIDSYYQVPVSSSSKWWNLPNILITPKVSPRPKGSSSMSFHNFRYNLRQFLHGNFVDMKNVLNLNYREF
jgi:phosphoglycerate dehydrogenase-like enzyme